MADLTVGADSADSAGHDGHRAAGRMASIDWDLAHTKCYGHVRRHTGFATTSIPILRLMNRLAPTGASQKPPGWELGLVTLVILTTGVVAWVSTWWVPAYLALMVLIFAHLKGIVKACRQ